MIKAGFGIDLHDPYWIARKEEIVPALGVSPRELMQSLGDWGKATMGPDIWVTLAKQRLITMGVGMVLSDVRYPYEADWVRAMGGRIVHVTRVRALTVRKHSSEDGIPVLPGDTVLSNNSSIELLQQKIKDIT